MQKIISVVILVIAFSSCEKAEETDQIPQWLEPRIEELASDQQYVGTVIYRYDWEGSQFYEVWIPISSCLCCEVYDSDGALYGFVSGEVQEFLDNRENDFVVWARNDADDS